MQLDKFRKEREWNHLISKEQKFLRDRGKQKENPIYGKIQQVIPPNLQSTLEKGFEKGFEIVFEKGTGIIEKTYNRKKIEDEYKIFDYGKKLDARRGGLKKLSQNAQKSKAVNMTVTAVEGGVMGVLGVGVPDIPVFLGLLLKSVYEISLHYGYHYDTPEEQLFILQLMETAMSRGRELQKKDLAINRWIETKDKSDKSVSVERLAQIQKTSQKLSEALLYVKFIQTLPIVGVIGGAVDAWCLNEITTYAQLKYQRRYLVEEEQRDKEKRP